MSKMSRTKTVYINSSVTLISQIFQVILGFVIRKLFIDYLGVEYLGYNSVFANILQMLNLADMGIYLDIRIICNMKGQKSVARLKCLRYIRI